MAAAVAYAEGHYHNSINSIGRGTGQCGVVGKAAYRAGECLFDERTGAWHDYRYKADRVIEKYIELPTGAAAWGHDRNRLWNASEAAEPRKNGRNATELELALPHALNDQQRHDMLAAYVRQKVETYGVAADVAVHFGRAGNIHAHVVLSHRKFGAEGFGEVSNARTVSKIVKGRLKQITVYGLAANPDAVKELRREWAEFQNAWFEKLGLDIRVDHRSFEERGSRETPTIHLGPKAAALEARGIATDRGDINRIIELGNAEVRRLEAEKQRHDAEIIDLQAKLAERAAHQAAAGRRDEITPAKEQPKDQPMQAQEPRNQNDAYKGAADYMAACEAEFARQAEAAKGLPDPFQPPPPQNENERQALKMWLAELDKQLAEHQREGAPSFRPSAPQPGRYDDLKAETGTNPDARDKSHARDAANQNQREPQSATQPETQAQQFRLDAINPDPWNALPDLDFSAAPEARTEPEASPAPTAPEKAEPPTGERRRAAHSEFLGGIADRIGGFISYLSDLISPPPTPEIPPEQIEDAIQRVEEAEEAARAQAYRGYVPGYDPEPPGRRDWRGIERPEPHADFARERGRDPEDDLEPD
jgi:MobA/MobL family